MFGADFEKRAEIRIFAEIFYDVKIKEVIFALERFAPLPLQEGYDNAGLQVGLTEVEASGALLCLDVTEEVLDEAISLGCNLVVSHHPLLFRGLKTIADRNSVERCVRRAIQNDITIYAMHTNVDNAEDGVNFKIAEKLEMEQVKLLQPRPVRVKEAGMEHTVMAGNGVVGVLPIEEDAMMFLQRLKSVFHVDVLMHNELLQRPVRKVVVCGGAGDFMLDEALAQQADAFVTGEMHYHQYFGHEQEIQIAVMGHYQSEQYTKEIFYSIIGEACPDVPVFMTSVDTNPIKYL
jgi:dinuclear metal center YbgI/SA1388 family protein